MSKIVWIVAIITGGVIVISESLIVASHPASNAPLITDVTTLAALGASTYATLRATLQTKRQAVENSAELQKIKRNVNGNISEMVALLRVIGVSDDEIERFEKVRALLDDENAPEVKPRPSLYLPGKEKP